MGWLNVTVSSEAAAQRLAVREVDGKRIILSLAASGGKIGSIFGGAGSIVGGTVGLIVGGLFAIFGDQKRGAMGIYRGMVAEVMGQIDPGSFDYIDKHHSVMMKKPLTSNEAIEIVRQIIIAIQSEFSPGSDDWNDTQEAIRSLTLSEHRPCCNRTILSFEVKENDLPTGSGLLLAVAAGALAIYNG